MTIRTWLDDTSHAIAYLRQDVVCNHGLLQAIERGVPPFPSRVCAVLEDATVTGVILLQQFPLGPCATVRAESVQGAYALLQELDAGATGRFTAPVHLWEAVETLTEDRQPTVEIATFAFNAADISQMPMDGEVRLLTADDAALADAFPPADDEHEPTLSDFVQTASAHPEQQAVYGLIADGEVVSFVQFEWIIDEVWEVSMIRTHPDRLRRGYAKALLSAASGTLAKQGLVPIENIGADNEPSLRTASAVGYRDVCRVRSCLARLRA
jgi:GNAT superfamily N-acetyltransferase